MQLNIDMGKVYEIMQPISYVMNEAYNYAVDFTDEFIDSMQNVLAVFS